MGRRIENVWRAARERLARVAPRNDTDAELDDELDVEDLADALPNLFGHASRRVWCHDGRAHIELRELAPEDFVRLGEAIEEQLASDGLARLHDLNTVVGRAIVQYPADTLSPEYFDDAVSRAEASCGLDELSFPLDRPKYPADAEPIARLLVELVADASAATLGTFLKATGFKPGRTEFDLAAVVALVEHTPRLRSWVEEKVGTASVQVGLGSAGAFLHAVGSGPTGPAIALLLKSLTLRGEIARRWAWVAREPALTASPRINAASDFERPERPRPLPEGEIERYAEGALFASLGGFAVGLLDTENLEASFAPLFTGLPKAAKQGREAFVAELNRVLGDRGTVVMRPLALERLDRISTVVVDGRLLARGKGIDLQTDNFVIAVRKARLELVLVGGGRRLAEAVAANEWIEVERGETPEEVLVRCVTRLQREGEAVALFSPWAPQALLAADLSVGFHRHDVPPWEADIIAEDDLDDATFLVEACLEARLLSSENIVLAATGAALGALTNVGGGIGERSAGRVMAAVNAASVLALGNGIRRVRALERRPRPLVPDETLWHQMSAARVVEQVSSDPQGLTNEQASERLVQTQVEDSQVLAFARAMGREVMNPFTPILAGGAALAAIVGSSADAVIVGAAMALSAGIGGTERFAAERSIARLERTERVPLTVLRDGREVELEPSVVVVGDVVLLEAGDIVAGDCRILESRGLEVDQSSLTGESLTVKKSARVSRAKDLSERSSMVFEGTVVTNGSARVVVVAVGAGTQLARATRLAHAPPEAGVERRLHELAELTLPAAAVSGLMLASVGLAKGRDLRSIIGSSVGLAVASVPEGLPMLSTMAQLAAARRLARRGIIVRNPRTIEALGRVDIVCVDKTGTLTEGRIRLHGTGARLSTLESPVSSPANRDILASAWRATPSGDDLRHATDRAISDGARDVGIALGEGLPGWRALSHLPFGHERAFHATLGESDLGCRLYVKGAPETILARCTRQLKGSKAGRLRDAERQRLAGDAEQLAAYGRRVLCVAMREASDTTLDDDDVTDLTFLGFVTLTDRIRGTTSQAIQALREGGIRVLMITGDHPQTAHRIGIEAGIFDAEQTVQDVVVTGAQIDRLNDEELAEALRNAYVVARATPLHKVRVVRTLQAVGHTVAMTGDGGNDASAIRLANVGIALGRESSRAARHAADMIVVDAHMETIVDGIAEGRAMWPAVRDAVALLIGGNLGEIGFTVAAGLFGENGGLSTRQLLLVNLLTDIAPAMAVALQPPTSEQLRASLAEGVDDTLGDALEDEISARALAIGGGAAAAWALARALGSEEKAATVALLSLVGTQVGLTLTSGHRSRDTVVASAATAALLLGIVETPGLSQVFDCRPIGPIGLGIAASTSIAATYAAQNGREYAKRFAARARDFRDKGAPATRRSLLSWPFADLDFADWFVED